MHRAYLVVGALIVSLFGYGQYNYWSVYGSDAGTKEGRSSSSSTGTRGK